MAVDWAINACVLSPGYNGDLPADVTLLAEALAAFRVAAIDASMPTFDLCRPR